MANLADLSSRVKEANRFLLSGRSAEARAAFLGAWEAASILGDDFSACAAAHMLGVMEPMPPDWKLRWHDEALERAKRVRDGRVDTWYASLYLNLGSAYRLVGRLKDAIAHYELAERHARVLDDSPYADAIRESVRQTLAELRITDSPEAAR